MKFLHTADVHLGGANAAERMQAFEHMLEYCAHNNVQLLLIAGDLFETARADRAVRDRAFDLMRKHPDLSILIAAGNHDPYCAGGNYEVQLPGNVYVFGEKWSCVRIEELNVRVWGMSFTAQSAPRFEVPGHARQREDGVTELGVLHGELVSENAESGYRGISREAIAQTGVDYLALGHVHQRSEVMRARRTCYAYSGCLQGAGFDETGEKGAYLGCLDENGLRLSFVRLCGSMWREETLDITKTGDITRVAQEVRRALGRTRDHVRLRLTGQAEAPVDTAALERLIGDCAASIRIEDDTERADYEAWARENTLRGDFVRRMLDRIGRTEAAGGDAAAERLALRYGLAAFEGEVRTHVDREDPDR